MTQPDSVGRRPDGNPNTSILTSMHSYSRVALVVGGVGVALSLLGFFLDTPEFWQAYLLAYLFWLEISLGCLGVLLLHHVAGGRWSELIRPTLQAGAMTLPWMALLFVPLLLGISHLYPWTDGELVRQTPALQAKSAYLNIPFFVGRTLFYFAVWSALALLLRRWSFSAQNVSSQYAGGRDGPPYPPASDGHGGPSLHVEKIPQNDGTGPEEGRLRRLATGGLILYILTATFAGFDWLMSLEPTWFSSIYGLLWIAGQGVAAFSLAVLGLTLLLRQRPAQEGEIYGLNDLGNLLLAFVMIWAYFAFSQYLIIWSANIPEEAVWYAHRTQGGWQGVALLLIGGHFVIPFLFFLSRQVKRNPSWMIWLALWLFLARGIDLYWLVTPAFHPAGVHLHWLQATLFVAIGGLWTTLFLRRREMPH